MKDKVKRYMVKHLDNYLDVDSELNFTALAEDAACEFNLYSDADCTIPEWLFELAVDLSYKIGVNK